MNIFPALCEDISSIIWRYF